MKTVFYSARKLSLVGCVAWLLCAASAVAEVPVIESIQVRDTNLVVTALVPAGHLRLTLEARDRLREGTWSPVAVRRLSGRAETVTFQVDRTRDSAVLRVRADVTEPLPAAFYAGTNVFAAAPSSEGRNVLTFDGATGVPASGAAETSREVAESDIWRLEGDTLYFFNQYRGLQVIDVSKPDAASLRGTLNLPAAGEQMYVLPPDHVVLLTRGQCSSYGLYSGGVNQSEVLIVAVNQGVPAIVTNLPVAGTITESRMVGTALYVASQTTRQVTGADGTTWEWGTEIASFDLAQPGAPACRSKLWYPGYGHVIHATDTYLFAVTQDTANWRQSHVQVIDITSLDGTMAAYATLTPAGRVADKFKLDWTAGVFSIISEVSASPLVTKLETFRLPDPRTLPPLAYVKLGEVELGHGERLFATRFDYPRAYVVTFLQIDPLWVVDLSDPARPKVSGELQVPGWSTYIHPRGNQLVAVGVETNRTTVSLFDVADPSHPALLSRAQLGSQYSYSEANNDEKAFTVLDDAGLILLPVQGYTDAGYASWVQLIDLGADALTVRGRIEHSLTPRRATAHRDRIISVSGVELLSVDATDREHPKLTGRLDLAWPINRVLLANDYLIELTTGNYWDLQSRPVARVASTLSPDMVLATLHLTNAPVVGAVVRDDRLYLAQANTSGGLILYGGTNALSGNTLWLTVVDLSHLPALSVLGETAVATEPLSWNAELTPLWLGPDLLVWVGGSSDNFYWWGPWDVVPLGGPVGIGGWYWPNRQAGGGGRLFAFDVSGSPAWRSEVDLTTTGWWSFSKPFAADGRVYLSHQSFVELVTTNGAATNSPFGCIVPWPTAYQRSFLDVVDYADPDHPTVRPPVSLPGTLQGISHGGALLYTIGFHSTSTNLYDGAEALDASAYDGVAVHFVDSLSLSNVWQHPMVVTGTNIFLGRAQTYYGADNSDSPVLETWALSSVGRFTRLGSVKLLGAASDLVTFPGLLAAQLDWTRVQVFDTSDAAALRQVGEGPVAGCLNFNLGHADAAFAQALWLPLDFNGVTRVGLSP